MVKNALLEIGTEEIPASYIEPAMRQMGTFADQYLKESGIECNKIVTYATPRRLALYIEKLAEKSEDKSEEITGPSVKVARDSQGNFTMAAKGFASKHNIPPEKLTVKKTDKGEYLCVKKVIRGGKTEVILGSIFADIIQKISFPKTMIWEPTKTRFARPIRTLIALYGNKILKFQIAGIKTSNWTNALHTVAKKKVVVLSPEKYLINLKNNCVIVNPEERIEVLKKVVENAAKRIKGHALLEGGLLQEVNYLIEHPVPIIGQFDKKYLELPAEVLITCMRKKQKYFPIVDANGKLTNNFIGIRNGISEHQDIVKEGYEKVLTARLEDAEFFYKQDTRTKLYDKSEKLKGVTLQKKLGSVYDKVTRVEQLVIEVSRYLEGRSETFKEIPEFERVCFLSKADLVTEMVFEYPELQGVIGRIYAEKDGESKHITKAIEEHYLPLTGDGKLPKTEVGIVLALADKIDTIVGNFAAGLKPSGSADPYGLRRAAIGIIRIIDEKKLRISLVPVVQKSLSLLPDKLSEKVDIVNDVLDFLRQRFEGILQAAGYKFDEIRAILATGFDDIVDIKDRLNALKKIRALPDFNPLAGLFKRTSNILKQADKMQVVIPETIQEELFSQDEEKNLYKKLQEIRVELEELSVKKDYESMLKKMVALKPLVDAFFDKVMVMVDDVKVKENRLSLLKGTVQFFFSILDFSQLQG